MHRWVVEAIHALQREVVEGVELALTAVVERARTIFGVEIVAQDERTNVGVDAKESRVPLGDR